MSSDHEFSRYKAEKGDFGPKAQLKEFKRQLRWLPQWLSIQKREHDRMAIALLRKVERLEAKIAKGKR